MAWSSKGVRRQLAAGRVQLSPLFQRGGGVDIRVFVYSRILKFLPSTQYFWIFFRNKDFIKISQNLSYLDKHLVIFSENISIRAKQYRTNPKTETREQSSYLKTDKLHTSLSNKETSSHQLRHRQTQRIPPITKSPSQTYLSRTVYFDSRPEHEISVSNTQNIN